MTENKSERGFQSIECEPYLQGNTILIAQSSAIGNYKDAIKKPGSSYLWVGHYHCLNREQVTQLRDYLNRWLEDGRLFGEKR